MIETAEIGHPNFSIELNAPCTESSGCVQSILEGAEPVFFLKREDKEVTLLYPIEKQAPLTVNPP